MEFKQLEAFVAVVDYKLFRGSQTPLPDPANYKFPYTGIRKRAEFPTSDPYHQTDEGDGPWNAAL